MRVQPSFIACQGEIVERLIDLLRDATLRSHTVGQCTNRSGGREPPTPEPRTWAPSPLDWGPSRDPLDLFEKA